MQKNLHPPSPEATLEQLEKILSSSIFERSSRSSDFLTYVVKTTLAGQGESIKGYTIGIEVFKKPEDFNPDTDASVRVEATRLRKSLELYYHTDGLCDPIIIKIPKGGYTPLIYRREVEKPPPPQKITPSKRLKSTPKNNPALAGIAALLLIAILMGGYLFRLTPIITNKQLMATKGPLAPIVAILPFYTIGDINAEQISNTLNFKLISKLSRFDSLYALNNEAVSDHRNWQGHSTEIAESLDAHYLVEGTVKKNVNDLQIGIRILDLNTKNYVWSYEQAIDLAITNLDTHLETVTSEIASKIGSPYGIVQTSEHARMEQMKGSTAEAYSCVLNTYVYANNQNRERHKIIRKCLEEAVRNFPYYVEAWSLLSYIYADESRFGFNTTAHSEISAQRALDAAQKAINISPNSARAHQYMAEAAKLFRNKELIRHHTQMALTLNPYDSDILANAGWSFGEFGEWEKAKEFVEQAIRLNPAHPRWYQGILFAYYFEKGAYEEALFHALRFYQEDDLFALLALAGSYAGLFRNEEAARIARDIEEKFPRFLKKPETMLMPLGFQKSFIEKLLIAAEAAGVRFQHPHN